MASFQVCTSWVHVVDAVLWPASTADASAVPDPTPGGTYPAGQQQSPPAAPLPTAAALWCACPQLVVVPDTYCTQHEPRCMHSRAPGALPRPEARFACCWVRDLLGPGPLSIFAQSPQSSLLARSLIDLPPLPPDFARYTYAIKGACKYPRLSYANATQGITVVQWNCLANHAGIAFHPLRSVSRLWSAKSMEFACRN